MAVIKQACPKCGQRVSGDESFYGTSVECPICTSQIFFPDPNKKEDSDQKASAGDGKTGEPGSADDSAAAEKDKQGEKESSSSSSSLQDLAERKAETETRDDQEASAPPKLSPPRSSIPLNQPATYSEAPSPTLSIMSMVLGILNAVTFCLPSMLLAPAAIICGHIALIKGQFSPIQPAPGRSMAIAGLILGYIGMAVMFIVLGLAITGVFNIFDWTRGHFDNGTAN